MESKRRNRNRGYQELRVWDDAITFYGVCCGVFRRFPSDLRRVASQAIASSDSVHRNIAEGYCRRSLNEYLLFLNYALASLGESVSGLAAYRLAEQISEEDFENLDSLAYKLENGLLNLVASLERKRTVKTWNDDAMVRESNALYSAAAPSAPSPQHPITPVPLPPPTAPSPQHPITPSPLVS